MAKCTLAEMYDFNKEEFDRSVTRKSNIVKARRILIYFLVDELNIKFIDIPKHMKCLKTHAGALHHFNKMVNFMKLYKEEKVDYNEFKKEMLKKGITSLEKELRNQIKIQNEVNTYVDQLKNMINEA